MGRTKTDIVRCRSLFLGLACFALAASADFPAGLPLTDGFEHGIAAPWWGLGGDAGARNRILNTGAGAGSWHLVMDSATDTAHVRNEATLRVNLEHCGGVTLSFLARSFGGAAHALPSWSPYTGSPDWDGIAASPDGVTWYPVRPLAPGNGLTESHTRVTVDLDAALATWNVAYTADFRIRFVHYDRGPADGTTVRAGLGLDDLRIAGRAGGAHDFGDAPDPAFPTLLEHDSARHARSDGPFLGTRCDYEADGLPGWAATGDDLRGEGDEDGVTLEGPPVAGGTMTLRVAASSPCLLDAWVDFGQNGAWTDAGDRIFTAQPLAAGENVLSLAVPAGAVPGPMAYARFRVSSLGGLDFFGPAPDGEVEDYRFAVTLGAPVMTPEPLYTLDSENTVTWSAVPGAALYRAVCARDADFTDIVAAGAWSAALSRSFTGLEDTAHHYRAQAGVAYAGGMDRWAQAAGAFAENTLANAVTDPEGRVVLAQTGIRTDTVGKAGTKAWSNTGGTRCNVFKVNQGTTLVWVDLFLWLEAPSPVEIVVYEGGETALAPFNKIQTVGLGTVPRSFGFVSAGPLEVPMSAGKFYAIGGSWENKVYFFREEKDGDPSFGEHRGIIGMDNAHPAPATLSDMDPVPPYYMRLRTRTGTAHAAAGTCVSPPISPPSLETWGALSCGAETPPGTALAVDILPETGENPVPGFTGLADGASLAALPRQPVRLRARLSTTNAAATPALSHWGVSWKAEPGGIIAGPWSNTVHSIQDGTPPRVTQIILLDPSPTRAAQVRFRVAFNKPVFGVGDAPPFADFLPRGGLPGAAVLSVEAGDSSCDVTVATGGVSGALGLDVLATGGIRDHLGRAMAADYTGGPGYALDFIPPRVTEIVPLDPSPTNASVVRWRVQFSEPVTGVPTAPPFAGVAVEGLTGAAVISLLHGGSSCVVSAATGGRDGALRLRVRAAECPLADAAGWPLAEDALSAAPYQMAHLRWTQTPSTEIQAKTGDFLRLTAAAAGGVEPRRWQWFHNAAGNTFLPVQGGVFPSLTLSYVSTRDAGAYYCEAWDAHETIQTPVTRLTVENTLNAPGGLWLVALALLAATAGAWRLRRTKRSAEERIF